MLITHVKPAELWGKKVYDTESHLLGEVIAIGSRRGVVRKVVVLSGRHRHLMRFMPSDDTPVDFIYGSPRLRLLH
jgi:hypothetical protein